MRLLNILIALALLFHPIIIAQTLLLQSEQDLSLAFYMIPDHALFGSVIAKYHVWDEFACCHKCVQNTRCLSFNYGITTNPNLSICEISSSEQALNQEKLLRRFNFKYHGIIDHCLSAPCLCTSCFNGGTCILESRGRYGCKCPLEIADVPFISSNCSVDNSLIERSGVRTAGVYHAAVSGNRYRLTFYEARRMCEILGGNLASHDQLFRAWQAGMQNCRYGWLSDATVRYPMQKEQQSCGNRIGLIGSSDPVDKNMRYDAYCYSECALP